MNPEASQSFLLILHGTILTLYSFFLSKAGLNYLQATSETRTESVPSHKEHYDIITVSVCEDMWIGGFEDACDV